eukprot:GHVN01099030.1.p1 GENE.GHVN01099030.1~~GHVN01099030.1.p1  ORF type:complete len:211 (+),score=8.62 GHVN01099030.1:2-634(+)
MASIDSVYNYNESNRKLNLPQHLRAYIGNLSIGTTVADIEAFFVANSIKPERITLIRQKNVKGYALRSLGYGFVQFASEEDFNLGCKLDKATLKDREIIIGPSRERTTIKSKSESDVKPRNSEEQIEEDALFISNLPYDYTDESAISNLFGGKSVVKETKIFTDKQGRSFGVGKVIFNRIEDLNKIIENQPSFSLIERQVKYRPFYKSTN